MAIAGFGSNNEVELYESGNWYNQPRFPEEDYFYAYSVATYEDLLYVFGELNFNFDRHFITLFYFHFRWSEPRWKISSYWSNDWFGTWMDQGTRTPYFTIRSSINSHWKSDLPYWWIRKSVRILNFDFKIKSYHLGKRKGGQWRKIRSRKNCSIWNLITTMSIQKFLQSIEITVHFFEKNFKINFS